MKIKDLDLNLTDSSAKEYGEELLEQLTTLSSNFDTHAMSERKLFLDGQLDMLNQIINYIQRTL